MAVVKMLSCLSVAALLAAVMAGDAQAQGRRGRGGMRPQGVSPLTAVTYEPVQKELGLKPEQVEKVKDLGQDVREEMQQEFAAVGGGLGGGDLSREERQKRMAELRGKFAEINKKINAKFLPKLNEILDKKQQTRLHEVAIQIAGAGAFEDADVAKELALTAEQKDKLKGIDKEFQDKNREAFSGGGDRSEIAAKMAELREEHLAKATEVLTADQQAKFKNLKGAPFDTKQIRFGGGRRRRNNDN